MKTYENRKQAANLVNRHLQATPEHKPIKSDRKSDVQHMFRWFYIVLMVCCEEIVEIVL